MLLREEWAGVGNEVVKDLEKRPQASRPSVTLLSESFRPGVYAVFCMTKVYKNDKWGEEMAQLLKHLVFFQKTQA